jgi:hypothetical protein
MLLRFAFHTESGNEYVKASKDINEKQCRASGSDFFEDLRKNVRLARKNEVFYEGWGGKKKNRSLL